MSLRALAALAALAASSTDDVAAILAQGVAEAQARAAHAAIAVFDRVSNVLAVYRMGAPAGRQVAIATELDSSGHSTVHGGREGIR